MYSTVSIVFKSCLYVEGATKSMKKSRLSQLISWCGGAEFNGCLVFDECHRAKNFVPVSKSPAFK